MVFEEGYQNTPYYDNGHTLIPATIMDLNERVEWLIEWQRSLADIEDPQTLDTLVHEYLSHSSRVLLVRNPNLTPRQCEYILRLALWEGPISYEEVYLLLRHHNFPVLVLRDLFREVIELEEKEPVPRDPISMDYYGSLSDTTDLTEIAQVVQAENHYIPRAYLAWHFVTQNPLLTDKQGCDILSRLMGAKRPIPKAFLVRSPNFPSDILYDIALQGEDKEILRLVADHSNSDEETKVIAALGVLGSIYA
jgi:hypothetical protein